MAHFVFSNPTLDQQKVQMNLVLSYKKIFAVFLGFHFWYVTHTFQLVQVRVAGNFCVTIGIISIYRFQTVSSATSGAESQKRFHFHCQGFVGWGWAQNEQAAQVVIPMHLFVSSSKPNHNTWPLVLLGPDRIQDIPGGLGSQSVWCGMVAWYHFILFYLRKKHS